MKMSLIGALPVLLAACAGYSGNGLIAGRSGADEVIAVMGVPRLEWTDASGARRLAYPRGPMGVHTFMALIGPDGKLQRIENVMTPQAFSGVQAGMSKDQVLRALGPPEPSWTVYFKARDELVWEWRYCDPWGRLARFDVLFDGSREIVRSTMTRTEDQTGNCPDGGCGCAS